MSELTKLVPPLELCKLIPAGKFAETALVWIDHRDVYPEENANPSVVVRKIAWAATSKKGVFPAPTLQEIMAEIPFAQVSIFANGSFVIHPRFGEKRYMRCHDDNAATAAIKLWLKQKGIEYEQEQG